MGFGHEHKYMTLIIFKKELYMVFENEISSSRASRFIYI